MTSIVFKLYIYLYVICNLCIFILNAHDCLKEPTNRKCTFGTKTPYRYVANYNDSYLEYNGCEEKKIWMMVRHGTRYPSKKHIRRLLENIPVLRTNILNSYQIGKSNISNDLAKAFYTWETNISLDLDVKLGTEGENEMIDLAKRTKSRFPSLFPDNYDMNIYDIHHTPTQRTEQSAKYFSLGLFGRDTMEMIDFPITEEKTIVLRFYKKCKRWQKEINHNPIAYEEKVKFLESEIVSEMLKNVSNHLGFEVNNGDVRLMRMMCVFENALNKSTNSPWCDIFSYDQLKILEYAEDIGYYWIDGYGHRLTYEQACPALKNMFDFFQSDTNKSVTAYFTHSGTILKLLALLNVAKDEQPLTHDVFLSQRDKRNWRVSIIDAFGTNIAFILFDCKNHGPSILTMHQERVIYLPGCPQDRPCPLDIMKELYVDTEEECQFDTMCSERDKIEL